MIRVRVDDQIGVVGHHNDLAAKLGLTEAL
jgi:hypothetical protein